MDIKPFRIVTQTHWGDGVALAISYFLLVHSELILLGSVDLMNEANENNATTRLVVDVLKGWEW